MGTTAGVAAQAAEARKHAANGQKCTELGDIGLVYLLLWSHTVPGAKKPRSVSHSLPHDWLSTHQQQFQTTFDLYSRLNLALTRSNARAIISRSFNLVDFAA